MQIKYQTFNERADRSCYIYDQFQSYLQGRVLDVGCDEALLKDYLPTGTDYTGVDVAGKPDLRLNLEKIEALPFDDNCYDVVLCSDVLEHLNNLHDMFAELVRVSNQYIIISLPNCWCAARRPIERGKGGFAHYGLPHEVPQDRHKWFFNLTQAYDFYAYQAQKYQLTMLSYHATEKPRLKLVRGLRKLRYQHESKYLNRYAHTLWVVYEKNHSAKNTEAGED